MTERVIPLDENFTAVYEPTEFKILDSDERIIEGYATTETVDRENEIITREAVKAAIEKYMMFPTIRFMHERKPIGKAIDFAIDHKGLRIKAKILKNIKEADEAWLMIKEGILKAFSIGGRILEAKQYFDKEIGKTVRKITKMELLEVSLVDVPANPETLITVLSKSLDKAFTAVTEEIEKADSCRARYINEDGSFKNGFDGCVAYFMNCKGLKEENAKKLCAYIGRKAGKIKGVTPEIEDELINFTKWLMDGDGMSKDEKIKKQEEAPTEEGNNSVAERVATLEERITKLESVVSDLIEKLREKEENEEQAEVTESAKTEVEKIAKPEKEAKPIRKAIKEENTTPSGVDEKGVLELALKKRFGVEEDKE